MSVSSHHDLELTQLNVTRSRMFGIKDVFTTINCLGGVLAIILSIEGHPFEGGLAIIIGYICGDAVDGWVARKLGTANAFGAEFDTISDHLAHTIAPAAVTYAVYADSSLVASELGNQIIGGVLAAMLMVTASIRHARNVVQVVSYKGIWSGLPRPVMGFLTLGFVLSATVSHFPVALWAGLGLIPLICWAALTRLPFANHHLPRKHYAFVRFLIALTFAVLIGAIAFYPRILFDLLFIAIFLYTVGSASILTRQERADYRAAVEQTLSAQKAAE